MDKRSSVRVLITGGFGQVGSEFENFQDDPSFHLLRFSHEKFDLTNVDRMQTVVNQETPDVIINCAAYTAVDQAESDNENASKVNHEGVCALSLVCAVNNIPLIHLSTDYVFDGHKGSPYHEEDQTNPLGVYGQTKYLGEEAIRANWHQHIILRVSGVFGVTGNNFVKSILKLAGTRETLKIVSDQITCLTPARDVAQVCLQIVKQLQTSNSSWGTYHYCGAEAVTWYQFAEHIIAIASKRKNYKVKQLLPVTSDEYPSPTKRPKNAVLDCQKIATQFGIKQKSWMPGLQTVIHSLGECNVSTD